eukprot:gene6638-7947_t
MSSPPPPISTSYNSFDEEPPLLEELGIDPALVFRKSLAILNPLKLDATLMDDGDLSGPLLYGLALGSCHLLVGKIQFGDILGFSVVALVGLYWLLNVLAGPDSGGIELHRYWDEVEMTPCAMWHFGDLETEELVSSSCDGSDEGEDCDSELDTSFPKRDSQNDDTFEYDDAGPNSAATDDMP